VNLLFFDPRDRLWRTVWRLVYRRYMERKTSHWPVAVITIMHRARIDGTVTLSYRYEVDGEVYGGFCECRFRDHLDAQEYFDRLGKCPAACARYDPRKPERSWLSVV
jgi:hypothetical protein